MKVLAITGGIGSGKTLVVDYLAGMGAKTLKFDILASTIMNTNEDIKKQIISEFGEMAYNDDELNRKYISDVVFSEKLNYSNSMKSSILLYLVLLNFLF